MSILQDILVWGQQRILSFWFGFQRRYPICCSCQGCRGVSCCTLFFFAYSILGAWGGFCLNMIAIWQCNVVKITKRNPVTGELIEATNLGYGLLAREIWDREQADYGRCILYSDDEAEIMYDFWLKTARNLAFAGGVLGLITWTCYLGSCCCSCVEPWKFDAMLVSTCSLASISMVSSPKFIFFNWNCRENYCTLSNYPLFAVAAILYLKTVVLVILRGRFSPRGPHETFGPVGQMAGTWYDDDVEYELTVTGSAKCKEQESSPRNEKCELVGKGDAIAQNDDAEND